MNDCCCNPYPSSSCHLLKFNLFWFVDPAKFDSYSIVLDSSLNHISRRNGPNGNVLSGDRDIKSGSFKANKDRIRYYHG